MIYFSCFISLPEIVNICVKQEFKERNHQAKYHPDVDHLYVRSVRKAVIDADEQICQNQHGGNIHRDGRFKEEGFEKVSVVTDDNQENRGNIG